jgi:ABC-type multidrug transport system fused ATPase/permease subunit
MKDLEIQNQKDDTQQHVEMQEATRAVDYNAIIVAEDKETGSVSFKVFRDYLIRAGGVPFICLVLLAAVGRSSLDVITNVFLSWWTRNLFGWTTNTYMMVYGLLGVSQYLFALLMNAVFTFGAYKAAAYYHPTALRKLLSAPVSFFDSQPIGRILNRFSKDIESIDQMVWIVFFVGIVATFSMLGALTFLVYVDYRMLAAAVPLLICYYLILRFYQKSNIELKRYESVSRSPLYAHISETLNGLSTLKAYGDQKSFIEKEMVLMDNCQQPVFLKQLAGVWITIRLRVLASSLTLCMGLLATLTDIDRTIVGLALTYAIGFIRSLGLLLFAASTLENEFNSVERLSHYCKALPRENIESTIDVPTLQWPSKGQVEFKEVVFRYPSRPDKVVLNHLTFEIQAGHKVGIVGRTGSGKSTIMAALFRLVEIESGSIFIDGIDISQLELHSLRKSLQCIPQEPVLFTGTIRENLDLEGHYSDEQIWSVLAQIGFQEYVAKQSLQLDTLVEENGENFSVGQRQLLCLGRALLVKPYLLIMDEATASLDHETDQQIQKCIKEFPNTVISIAHRLNTIIDFDRVLVLSDGVVADYDIPHMLLSKDSLFATLCDATGPQNSRLLRSIALEKYQTMQTPI